MCTTPTQTSRGSGLIFLPTPRGLQVLDLGLVQEYLLMELPENIAVWDHFLMDLLGNPGKVARIKSGLWICISVHRNLNSV